MKVRDPSELLRRSCVLLNGRTHQQEVFLKRRISAYDFSLKVQKRRCSSTTSSNEYASGKAGAVSTTPRISTPALSTRIRAVASLLYDIAKTTTPSITIQIPASVSNLTNKLSFTKLKAAESETMPSEKAEELPISPSNGKPINKLPDKIPLYISVLGVQTKSKPEVKIPRWKIKRKVVSQDSIDARTRHVISAVARASNKSSLVIRLEDFCEHFFQYPQSKSLAAREGGIPLLLRLKHSHSNDILIQQEISEALTLLGHTEPLPSKGVRILAIDGGGTRGLLALRILRYLEEAVGRPIHESFDYICGVSTGAVLAVMIGARKKRVEEVEVLYRKMSQDVFRQDRSSGLGGLLWNHAYYNSEKWDKILQEHIGEMPLIKTNREPGSPKVSAVSSVVNMDVARPYIFRNYALPHRSQSQYSGSFRHRAWEAVRASSAAPGYFGEFKLEDNVHQDGGLLVNNPTAVAIHEARCLWPNANLQSVVSVGTGRSQPLDLVANLEGSDPSSTSWKQKLVKVIDSATDTERVHTLLHDLLPPKVYYRFNPYLSEVHGLDETDPIRWKRMLDDVDMYVRKNQLKMADAASTLNASRTTYQNVLNWIDQRKLFLQNPMDN